MRGLNRRDHLGLKTLLHVLADGHVGYHDERRLAHEITTVEAVVRVGVTPLPQTMLGAIGPLQRMFVAPLDATPIEANVAVPEPPVPEGKTMFACGEEEPVEDVVQPPVVRATDTRE